MLYGLYLSATGVITNSYRQDVIANNLANSETTGFKRDVAMFQQRLPADEENPGKTSWSDPMLDQIGGGTFAAPSQMDTGPGEVEPTSDPLDVSIQGPGFFSVDDHGKQRLTRNGSFAIDTNNNLVLNDDSHARVMDASGKPVVLNGTLRNVTVIAKDGTLTQANAVVGKLGVFNVDDTSQLKKEGGTLFSVADGALIKPSATPVQSGFLEKSNVEPATELTQLMDTQRQLEANANMIRYQDQTLSELVNTVGKVS